MVRLRKWAGVFGLTLLLAGCTQPATPTPTPAATPLPPVGVLQAGGAVQASGKVAPAQTADLALVRSGRVNKLAVAVGDVVPEGALLLALQNVTEEAAVTQAQAAYFRAQANQMCIRDRF